MVIRKAVQDDISVIVKFQQEMAYETENLSLDKSVLNKGVGNVFQDPAKGFYLLAQKENETIIATMLLTPEWSDWRNSLFLWIQSLYILPEYRHRGIFRKMYTYVKEMVADSDDYAGLKLYVDKNNIIAQKVYQQVGMQASRYKLFEWNKMNY